MSDQNQIPLFSIPSQKADPIDPLVVAGQGSADSCFASVILPLALPTTYTYAVPAIFVKLIQPGCRVEVVLGKNKKYAGIVKSISGDAPAYQTKQILNVLDDTPLVFPEQLELWKWMSDYYMCSEGEVMAAALPAHFKLSSETILLFNEDYGDDFSSLEC